MNAEKYAQKFEEMVEKRNFRSAALCLVQSFTGGPLEIVPAPEVIAHVVVQIWLRVRDPFLAMEASNLAHLCVKWFPSAPGFWREYWLAVFHVAHDLVKNSVNEASEQERVIGRYSAFYSH